MANMKVVLEIDVESKNPLDAAKEIRSWLRGEEGFQFYVQNEETGEIFSVDLDEEDEDAVLPVKEYVPLIEKKL